MVTHFWQFPRDGSSFPTPSIEWPHGLLPPIECNKVMLKIQAWTSRSCIASPSAFFDPVVTWTSPGYPPGGSETIRTRGRAILPVPAEAPEIWSRDPTSHRVEPSPLSPAQMITPQYHEKNKQWLFWVITFRMYDSASLRKWDSIPHQTCPKSSLQNKCRQRLIKDNSVNSDLSWCRNCSYVLIFALFFLQ